MTYSCCVHTWNTETSCIVYMRFRQWFVVFLLCFFFFNNATVLSLSSFAFLGGGDCAAVRAMCFAFLSPPAGKLWDTRHLFQSYPLGPFSLCFLESYLHPFKENKFFRCLLNVKSLMLPKMFSSLRDFFIWILEAHSFRGSLNKCS